MTQYKELVCNLSGVKKQKILVHTRYLAQKYFFLTVKRARVSSARMKIMKTRHNFHSYEIFRLNKVPIGSKFTPYLGLHANS
jgi:hypothetical protein